MTHEHYERFRRLLDLTDDYLARGIRRKRPQRADSSRAASDTRASQKEPAHEAAHEAAHGAAHGAAGLGRQSAQTASERPDLSAGGGDRQAAHTALQQEVTACTLCPLHRERTRAVPGTGVLEPRVLVIGEGPGADEDKQGLPFVGPAGRYLDDWLAAIELSRTENVYITNVVKCRPPGNRDPLPQEWGACNSYLSRQIALLQPQALLAVGRVASGVLTGSSDGIGRLRGRVHSYEGIPLVATYHPSGVLRNPAWRRPVWEDLKQLRAIISR